MSDTKQYHSAPAFRIIVQRPRALAYLLAATLGIELGVLALLYALAYLNHVSTLLLLLVYAVIAAWVYRTWAQVYQGVWSWDGSRWRLGEESTNPLDEMTASENQSAQVIFDAWGYLCVRQGLASWFGKPQYLLIQASSLGSEDYLSVRRALYSTQQTPIVPENSYVK